MFTRLPRPILAAALVGAALGAVACPPLVGMVLGYRAAAGVPARRFWAEFREVGLFYATASLADTVPRGLTAGTLLGVVAGLCRPASGCAARRAARGGGA